MPSVSQLIELEAETLDALTREHERGLRLAMEAVQTRHIAPALQQLDAMDAALVRHLSVAATLLESRRGLVADRIGENRAELAGLRARLCEDALRR